MKKVYSAQDLLMLGHLKVVLEANGIDCFFRKLHLAAGMGELPPIECWPELWVWDDEKYARAKTIVAHALTPLKSVKKSWECSRCGEVIEGQFLQCWNCGSAPPKQSTAVRGA